MRGQTAVYAVGSFDFSLLYFTVSVQLLVC